MRKNILLVIVAILLAAPSYGFSLQVVFVSLSKSFSNVNLVPAASTGTRYGIANPTRNNYFQATITGIKGVYKLTHWERSVEDDVDYQYLGNPFTINVDRDKKVVVAFDPAKEDVSKFWVFDDADMPVLIGVNVKLDFNPGKRALALAKSQDGYAAVRAAAGDIEIDAGNVVAQRGRYVLRRGCNYIFVTPTLNFRNEETDLITMAEIGESLWQKYD